jgi:hypothetical protein
MRSAVVGVVGLMILTLLAPSAGAHYRSHGDPRDTEGLGTPGNRSRIDIERVRLRIEDGDVVARIATYGRPAAWGEVRVFFDARCGPRMDRFAYVVWDDASGGWLERGLYRRDGGRVTDVHARKSDDVIRLRFPRSALDATRHLRWRVSAVLPSADGVFVDRAPDAGWYEH